MIRIGASITQKECEPSVALRQVATEEHSEVYSENAGSFRSPENGFASIMLYPKTEAQDVGSPPLIRWISPFRASFMVLRRSCTNGRRSASRFDLARRIR